MITYLIQFLGRDDKWHDMRVYVSDSYKTVRDEYEYLIEEAKHTHYRMIRRTVEITEEILP